MEPDDKIEVMRTDDPPGYLVSNRPPDELTRRIYSENKDSVVKVETALANGSGFAVKAPNLILTDYHVIAGAREIRVRLRDGRSIPAEIVSVDDIEDLALLRTKGFVSLKPLSLGDETKVEKDERVFALGHPHGLSKLYISAGIAQDVQSAANVISQIEAHKKDRPLKDYEAELARIRQRTMFVSTIKTEGGNSGGPLLNSKGEVIGVCDLKDTQARSGHRHLFTKASSVANLLNESEPKFSYKHEYYCETGWARQLSRTASEYPIETTTGTAFTGLALTGTGIHVYQNYRPGSFNPALRRGVPGLLALGGSYGLSNDVPKLCAATNERDLLKYSTATAGDSAILSGGALAVLSKSGSVRGKYGAALLGVGLLLRAGSEFVPNRLFMTSETRSDLKDDRPPAPFYGLTDKKERLP